MNKPVSERVVSQDVRVLRVCRDYLVRLGMANDLSVRWSDVSGYLLDINNIISSHFPPNVPDRSEFIDKMLSICNAQRVSESDVAWLGDDKACIWYWFKAFIYTPTNKRSNIKSSLTETLDKFIIKNHQGFRPNERVLNCKVFCFNELGLDRIPIPSSHKDRMDVIVEYLDRYSVDYHFKNKAIAELKAEWSGFVNEKDPLKWVDKEDKEQCEWVWNYFYSEVVSKFYFGGVSDVNALLPMSSSEKYLFSYGFFYNWSVHPSEKSLFILKMKNAWGQKKFRRKKAAKRSINTYIDVGVGEKLDKLVFHYDLTIHRTIEMLIKNEYERLYGKDK